MHGKGGPPTGGTSLSNFSSLQKGLRIPLTRSTLVLLFLFLFLIVIGCTPLKSLALRSGDDEVLAVYPFANGETFSVRYIHSVQKTPVIEVFFINTEGVIELRETIYEDFGAGLPFLVDGKKIFSSGGGKFRISGYAQPLGQIIFRIGRFADYHLLLSDEEIPFTRFGMPGSPLCFRGEVRPLLFSFFSH